MPPKRIGRRKSLRGQITGAKDRRFGRIKFADFGSRTRTSQVTTHPDRLRQFPRRHKTATNNRFTIPSDRFTYLPNITPARQLGVPTSLGDNVIAIIDFKPSKALKNLIDDQLGNIFLRRKSKNRKTRSNVQRVKFELRVVVRAYFKRLKSEIRLKIREIVPKFTGRLRAGMIASLTRSINKIGNTPFIFKLNTFDTFNRPIFYANPVNNMPTDWLAHPPNEPLVRMHKGTPKHLYDPNAETGWYEKVLDFARNLAQDKISSIRKDIIRLYGITQISELIYQDLLKNTKFK